MRDRDRWKFIEAKRREFRETNTMGWPEVVIDDATGHVIVSAEIFQPVDMDEELPLTPESWPHVVQAMRKAHGPALTDSELLFELGALSTLTWRQCARVTAVETLRKRIAAGDMPEAIEVAALVLSGPIPVDLRRFVADFLLGRVKRKRGRKRADVSREVFLDRQATIHRVRRWQRVFDRQRRRTGRSSDPYREALAKVAEETGIPESTLDKWCYPRSRQ